MTMKNTLGGKRFQKLSRRRRFFLSVYLNVHTSMWLLGGGGAWIDATAWIGILARVVSIRSIFATVRPDGRSGWRPRSQIGQFEVWHLN